MSDRRFQTTLTGGRVVESKRTLQLSDHVATAIRCAREHGRAWIKSRSTTDPSSVWYAVEFRSVDGVIDIAIHEAQYLVSPEAPTTPDWCREIATIARNVLCAV